MDKHYFIILFLFFLIAKETRVGFFLISIYFMYWCYLGNVKNLFIYLFILLQKLSIKTKNINYYTSWYDLGNIK